MIEKLYKGEEAREKLLAGVRDTVDAVGATLGPHGKLVVFGYPLSRATKDGVTVANNIQFRDVVKQQGAFLIKQAANKTVSDVGDGTTTATVLAGAIIEMCLAKKDVNSVRRELEKSVDVVLAEIDKVKIPMERHMIEQVATISGNNDEFVGRTVAEAYEKIGDGGVVVLKDNILPVTEVEYSKGMEFGSGFITPNFITNGIKFCAELQNCAVIITTEDVTEMQPTKIQGKGLVAVLQHAAENGISVLLIAKDVNGGALGAMVGNKQNKVLTNCCVRAPRHGIQMRDYLEDIASVTGATVIDPEKGVNLDTMVWEHVGMVKHAVVTKDKTILEGGAGNPEERAAMLKARGIENDDDKARYARLTGGVAVIKVGAPTDVERQELRDRFDDAYKAVKAAIEEGVVRGGGVTLMRIGNELLQKDPENVLYRALYSPFEKIVENAGWNISADAKEAIILGLCDFNAKTGKDCDALEEGIIDPAAVTKSCVVNAVSVAKIIILTEVVLEEYV
jgi:chaperonin GroEL